MLIPVCTHRHLPRHHHHHLWGLRTSLWAVQMFDKHKFWVLKPGGHGGTKWFRISQWNRLLGPTGSWARVLFLLTKRFMSSRAVWFSGATPFWSAGTSPTSDPWTWAMGPEVSSCFLDMSLSLHAPLPEAALILRWQRGCWLLSTLVAGCLLNVLERHVCCGGRAICPALFVLFLTVSFTFSSLRLQSILICSEDWVCSPPTTDHHFPGPNYLRGGPGIWF